MKLNITNEKTTLLTVIFSSFIVTFMGSAINLSIPTIGHEFNSSTVLLGWIVSGYILSSAAFSIPFGRLSDMTGRKSIFLGGLILFSVLNLLAGVAWTIQILIIIRLLQGISAAMIFSTNMALLVSAYPPQSRGKVLGYATSATYVGLSTGPVIGGLINHYLGWRAIFNITFALGLLVCVFAVTYLKEQHSRDIQGKHDLLGNILYIFWITALLYGISAVTTENWAKYLVLAGLILLAVFIFHEARIEHPIVQVNLFRNPAFSLSNLAALINYSATFAIGYLISLYLQTIQHFDSQAAGIILLSQPLVMAVFSPLAGRLSDKVEARIVSSIGMAVTALGLLVFAFLSFKFPVWLIVINLLVIGAGLAFFSSPNTNAIMSTVSKKYYGVTTSMVATMRLIGQATSMAIVTLIMSSFIGNAILAEAPADMLLKSMKTSFGLFTVICIIGIFASLKRGNMMDKE